MEFAELSLSSFQQFLGLLLGIVDGAHIEECLLGQVVDLAFEDGIEALDGVFDGNHHAGQTGELHCY